MKPPRTSALRAVKVVATALLLAYAVSASDLADVVSLVSEVRVTGLLALVPLLALDRAIAAARLWRLFLAVATPVKFRRIVLSSFVGIYVGYFIPSSVSVDGITAYLLGRDAGGLTNPVAVILVDRAISFAATITAGLLFASIWYVGWFSTPDVSLLLAALVAVVVSCLVGYFLLERLALWSGARQGAIGKAGRALRSLLQALVIFVKKPVSLATNVLLAYSLLAVRIAQVVVLAWALNIDVPWHFLALALCAVAVLLVIPISVGGLGLREATFVSLFALGGYSQSDGLVLSLALLAMDLLLVAIGGVIYSTHKGAFFLARNEVEQGAAKR